MKHSDFSIKIPIPPEIDLSDINVGNTYTVLSVNRTERIVELNRYSVTGWQDPNKLLTAETIIKIMKENK